MIKPFKIIKFNVQIFKSFIYFQDHIDFHFASIDENQMLDGCGYDDSKGDIGSEPDLPHENESIQSAHLHIRNTFERKPALKRKRWTKEKDPRYINIYIATLNILILLRHFDCNISKLFV